MDDQYAPQAEDPRGLRSALGVSLALLVAASLGVTLYLALLPPAPATRRDAWASVPPRTEDFDHSKVIQGPFESGPDVTRRCLECHQKAGQDMLASRHFTWEGDAVHRPGAAPVPIGKKNLVNNFCIGIRGNEKGCTACHAGYGWDGPDFDFRDSTKVDCLVCHEQTGAYRKPPGLAGHPAPGTDLVAAARSVGRPTRRNCGTCHFSGGGGDAVKHGDLDGSLHHPAERIDVHMGRANLQCVDCHRTQDHQISGRSPTVSVSDSSRVSCADCHGPKPHGSERLDAHVETVSCQACHIPEMAREYATKMSWDWSTAGLDLGITDPHKWLKIKGSFEYAARVKPAYRWWNGKSDRYLLGDPVDPEGVTALNPPRGDVSDPTAKLWPFKIHQGRQPFDPENRILLQPKTVGETGFWKTFEWESALRQGAEASGTPFSGKFGFTRTEMAWPLSHMVAPPGEALGCADCHAPQGRMDWEALGYPGDPARFGGRRRAGLLRGEGSAP